MINQKLTYFNGYKGFDKNMTGFNNYKYEVGKSYKMDGNIQVCNRGFHFCIKPENVLSFYNNKDCLYSHIFAFGKVSSDYQTFKYAASNIIILDVMNYEDFNKIIENGDTFSGINISGINPDIRVYNLDNISCIYSINFKIIGLLQIQI